MWQPKEIIVNRKCANDYVTNNVLNICKNIPVKFIDSGNTSSPNWPLDILTGTSFKGFEQRYTMKETLYIAPSINISEKFNPPDKNIVCRRSFQHLVLSSNGCYYDCHWCYLKPNYLGRRSFITILSRYDVVKKRILEIIENSISTVFFNTGELGDSLALEHLTNSAKTLIPFFSKLENGYLLMVTKSDNINDILNLEHNQKTIITWSMNADKIAGEFEIGAPSVDNRIDAAFKAQKAGYPVRIRLDPIIPLSGWKKAYDKTIEKVLKKIKPDKITIGTLRFDSEFYRLKDKIIHNKKLLQIMNGMEPVINEGLLQSKNKMLNKYYYKEENREEIYNHVIRKIKQLSDCKISLCKESFKMWEKTGLDSSNCDCVCNL